MKRYKKVRTTSDILADARIENFIRNYDGYGRHLIECRGGWKFEGDRTIDIGTIQECCEAINDWLEPDEDVIKIN